MKEFLIKSWVWTFYRTYAGMFFVAILVLFGFLRGYEHIAIAQFFTSGFENMAFPYILFVLYGWFIVHFSFRLFRNKKFRFTGELIHLSRKNRFYILFLIVMMLLVPVNIYSFFLTAVAFSAGMHPNAVLIIPSVILLHLVILRLLEFRLMRPAESGYHRTLDIPVPDGLKYSILYMLARHLLQGRTLSTLLTKVLTFSLLIVFTILLPTIDYYERYLNIVICTTFLSNSLVVFETHDLIFHRLTVFRNLPVRPRTVFFQCLVIFIVFTSPEIIYCFRNFTDFESPVAVLEAVMIGITFLLFIWSGMLITRLDQEAFIIRVFWLFLITLFLLLFDFSALLLAFLLFTASYFIFRHYFYKFEPVYTA